MYNLVVFVVTFNFVSSFLVFQNQNDDRALRINKTPKIINGKPMTVADHPSAVMFFNNNNMCSGTILNSWTILTAAHCLDPNKDVYHMIVQIGSTSIHDVNAVRYGVLSFDIHPQYASANQFDCDIALLFVFGPIKLGLTAQKAIITNDTSFMASTLIPEFVVTGWGMVKESGIVADGLMMTRLTLVPNDKCRVMHDEAPITANMLCLYGYGRTDSCKGDSGGGVFWRGQLVGIVSHGDGCAHYNKPSVYTNVIKFRHWIDTQIQQFYKKYCSIKGISLDKHL